MKFAFVFGKNWRLSLAELLAWLDEKAEVIDLTKEALIADGVTADENTVNSLGGTLKIVRVEKEFDFKDLRAQDFSEQAQTPLSFYGPGKLLPAVKKTFLRTALHGEYSATELVVKGISEYCLIFGLRTCYFGPTVAVSNPFEFKKRDEGRPSQRPQASISPSRARILVNLSCGRENLLDPFCGVGTVGQEAALAGVKTVLLSDSDEKCVEWTRRNMRWARGKLGFEARIITQKCDARKLEQKYNRVEAIATEPYLGPSFRRKPPRKQAEKVMQNLEQLYAGFFASARRVLRAGGRVAVVLPALNTQQGKLFCRKQFPGFTPVDIFARVPREYRDYWQLHDKTIIDEEREPGVSRIVAREFCVYEVVK